MYFLKKDQELQEASISRRTWERNVTIVGLVLTLVLAWLVVRIIRQRQKAATVLAAKNEELNRQRILELLREQELVSVHAMLNGQEAERRRIAQDLHDRLGSLLATVKLYFHIGREQLQQLPDKQQEKHRQGIALLDDACQEVRRIAHNMVSGVLMKFGLVAALQDMAQAITNSNKLHMQVMAHGLDDRLDIHMEIALYRMVQELVSNTLKHAQATELVVQLTRHEHSLNLLVEDNGIGFSPDQLKPGQGLGLQGIEARAAQLQGTISIDSGLGSGTTISVDLPLLSVASISSLVQPANAPAYETAAVS